MDSNRPLQLNPYESPQLDPYQPRDLDDGTLQPPDSFADQERLDAVYGVLFVVGVIIAAWFNVTLREAIRTNVFWFGMWPAFVTIAVDGAAIAGCMWIGWRRWRGSRRLLGHFGHWLLLVQTMSWLAEVIFTALYYYLLSTKWEDPNINALAADTEARLIGVYVFNAFLTFIVLVIAARCSPGQRLWHRYIFFIVLTYLWHLVAVVLAHGWVSGNHWVFLWITVLVTGLNVSALLIATIRDAARWREKDQLHWVGVGCQLTLLSLIALDLMQKVVAQSGLFILAEM